MFKKVESILVNFIDSINMVVLDSLDHELSEIMLETLTEITSSIVEKQEKGLDVKYLLRPHLRDFLIFTLRSFAVLHSYKMAGKPDPIKVEHSK